MDNTQVIGTVLFELLLVWVRVMVFNPTFNNISVISWQLVLLVEEMKNQFKIIDSTRFLLARHSRTSVGSIGATFLLQHITSENQHYKNKMSVKSFAGVMPMVSMLAMSTVYQDWVKPKSNKNSNHAALSSKSKDWLDQTCLSTDSELAL